MCIVPDVHPACYLCSPVSLGRVQSHNDLTYLPARVHTTLDTAKKCLCPYSMPNADQRSCCCITSSILLCRWWLQAPETCACTTILLTKCSSALWWAGLHLRMASSIPLPLALWFASCPSVCLLLGCLSLLFALPAALQRAFCWAAFPYSLLCLLPFSMPSAWLPASALCFAFYPSVCPLLGCLSLPCALPPALQHPFCLAACLCPLLFASASAKQISFAVGWGPLPPWRPSGPVCLFAVLLP